MAPADIYDEDSVTQVLEGADAAFFTHPLRARNTPAEALALIGRAAVRAKVGRVVWNTSSYIPDRPGDMFNYVSNTAGINALWRSGAPGTVFGSVLFMDNLLTNWAFPHIVGEGRYRYPHRAGLEASWISLDDVAKFMIAAIDRPDLEGCVAQHRRPAGAQTAAGGGDAVARDRQAAGLRPDDARRVRQVPVRCVRRRDHAPGTGRHAAVHRGLLHLQQRDAVDSVQGRHGPWFSSAFRSRWKRSRPGRNGRTGPRATSPGRRRASVVTVPAS